MWSVRKFVCGIAAALVILLSAGAAADPALPVPVEAPPVFYLRMRTETEICMLPDRVRCRILMPGRYVEESHWTELDAEMHRLQDQENRLDAENRSLRESASAWRPGWKTITAAIVVGLVGGVYIGMKL